MASHPTGHVRIQVVDTGETGHANPDEPLADGYVLYLDGGGTRILGRAEKIRLLPPGWDLTPPDGDGAA